MCIQMETSPNYLEDNFFKKYIVNFTIFMTKELYNKQNYWITFTDGFYAVFLPNFDLKLSSPNMSEIVL